MKNLNDTVNAFIKTFTVRGKPTGGALENFTFCVKDNYDVTGETTGYGNPDWARTHAPATTHAFAVERLLEAGATLLGKTHTDELAYSLMGLNAHYGTPLNTAAPDRIPGGSSSGSAAATAAGMVDIGLGSDTGGSIRVPASFCGIFGMRPTHGRISMAGLLPLAPSFDTVGWFARDASALSKAGGALGLPVDGPSPGRIIVPLDAWELADAPTVRALEKSLDMLQSIYGQAIHLRLSDTSLADWREVFRICQAAEIWQALGPWVTENNPAFGPGVRERFETASKISEAQWNQAIASRIDIAASLSIMLDNDAVIVMPTVTSPAPKSNATTQQLEHFRSRSLDLLCPAGLGGLPQLTLPAAMVDGGPVGLSLLGLRNSDGQLLMMARDLEKACALAASTGSLAAH